ncbi:MAG: hypothetical protein HC802_15335 [Caldilineaceae bacterium]|nr:hypothetical protein [Caldilineaceae bacterium]
MCWGGGFNSDSYGRFWEVVFDLPLTASQDRREWFRPRFLEPAGQPIFSAGVEVSPTFQPVTPASGQPIYRNLWVAGCALAHSDSIRERSLEGLAIATGRAAAQACLADGGGGWPRS